MLKRKVWPIFAWISGALVALNLALMGIAIFADSRFGWFLIPGVFFAGLSVVLMSDAYDNSEVYEKKPRGWRKERRRAEKEAYVSRLEQELLND